MATLAEMHAPMYPLTQAEVEQLAGSYEAIARHAEKSKGWEHTARALRQCARLMEEYAEQEDFHEEEKESLLEALNAGCPGCDSLDAELALACRARDANEERAALAEARCKDLLKQVEKLERALEAIDEPSGDR